MKINNKHVGKLQQKKLLRRVLIGASWAFFLSVKYSRTSVSNSSNDNDFQNSDGSRGGWEYFIITTLAENMNFKLDIEPPPNGERWGEVKNGTFNGRM